MLRLSSCFPTHPVALTHCPGLSKRTYAKKVTKPKAKGKGKGKLPTPRGWFNKFSEKSESQKKVEDQHSKKITEALKLVAHSIPEDQRDKFPNYMKHISSKEYSEEIKKNSALYEPKPNPKYSALFPGEEDIPDAQSVMFKELDQEYDELKDQVSEVLRDPEYMIYDSLTKARIRKLEMAHLLSDEKDSVMRDRKLDDEIAQTIEDTDNEWKDFYKQKAKMSKQDLQITYQTWLQETNGELFIDQSDAWKLQFFPEFLKQADGGLVDPMKELAKAKAHPEPITMATLENLTKPIAYEKAKASELKLLGTDQPGGTDTQLMNPTNIYPNYAELSLHTEEHPRNPLSRADRILAHKKLLKAQKRKVERDKYFEQLERDTESVGSMMRDLDMFDAEMGEYTETEEAMRMLGEMSSEDIKKYEDKLGFKF